MTDDPVIGSTPVLDRDALDDAAAVAVGGLRIDLDDARRRAQEHVLSRRSRRRGALRWTAVAAAAAAVLLGVLVVLPWGLVALGRDVPAETPTTPATLPKVIARVPAWTPLATDRPVARAGMIVQATEDPKAPDATGVLAPVIVAADGAGYRLLPHGTGELSMVALSPQGTRVAWIEDRFADGTAVRVLDLPTGQLVETVLNGSFGMGIAISSLVFSPDGTRLALQGLERFIGGEIPRVMILDAATARPTQQCRDCGRGDSDGLAWAGDGRLLAPGRAVAGVIDAALPGRGGAETPGSAWAGQRWVTLDPTARSRYYLLGDVKRPTQLKVSSGKGRLTDRTVATVDGAIQPVGRTTRGVLVTRSGASGSSLVEVTDSGAVTTLVTSPGYATVIAAAPGLLDGARFVEQASPASSWRGGAWRDSAWYSWRSGQAVDWLRRRTGLWRLLAAALPMLVAVLAFRRRPRLAVPLIAAAAGLTLLGSAALAHRNASAPPRILDSGGTEQWVVPDRLEAPLDRPPLAFEAIGRPRTTRLSAVVTDTQWVLGVDAATGQLVSLDALPEVNGIHAMTINRGHLALSPNGRFIATGNQVIDLATATVRSVAEATQDPQLVTITSEGTYLAVVPGTDNRVTVAAPGRPGTTLEGVSNVTALAAQGNGLVVAVTSENGTDSVLLIDPISGRLIAANANAGGPVAVTGPVADPTLTDIDPASGRVRVRQVDAGSPAAAGTPSPGASLDPPGAVDQLAGAADGSVVFLGVGGQEIPRVLGRLTGTDGTERQVVLGSTLTMTVSVAADVVSTARTVRADHGATPVWLWWPGFAVESGLLLLGAAVLLAPLRLPRSRRESATGP